MWCLPCGAAGQEVVVGFAELCYDVKEQTNFSPRLPVEEMAEQRQRYAYLSNMAVLPSFRR